MIVSLRSFSLQDAEVVHRKIRCIKTQRITGAGQTPLQVRPCPVHDWHEVIANNSDTCLGNGGQRVFPRAYEMLIGSRPELDRIVNGNAFHHRPDEARRENLIPSPGNRVQWPRLAAVEMVEGGDDSSGTRLLDVIEGNGIVRSKPPPSLLHVSMLSASSHPRPRAHVWTPESLLYNWSFFTAYLLSRSLHLFLDRR